MIRKIQEKINIFTAKSPQKAVLVSIMLFNAVFFMISAAIIAFLSNYIGGMAKYGFWESVYHTITMVLDAGCIGDVIKDVGKTGAFVAILCIVVVIVGMVFFTGAVIGYITNIISDFIDSKNNGRNKLLISDHVVIINWNSKAVEIINEMLYEDKRVKVVVFVQDDRKKIDEEIRSRLDATILMEANQAEEATRGLSRFARKKYLRNNLLKDKVTYIVREGDVASVKDLEDICISKAKTVIILENYIDENRTVMTNEQGNTQTIKTLIQVSEISKGNSNQIILVEAADNWTENLVYRIINFKDEEGKEKIIPLSYNRLLGNNYSQIAIMPELSNVFDNIFSNKGAHLLLQNVSEEESIENEDQFIEGYFAANCCAIPLGVTETVKGRKSFYMATSRLDLERRDEQLSVDSGVVLKKECHQESKDIIVIGHNSNTNALMEEFELFYKNGQCEGTEEPLRVVVVDDEMSLNDYNHFKDYPFVETLAADVYDEDIINDRILEVSQKESKDITVLILSDDSVENEDIDANVLTYLIYIQEQIRRRERNEQGFKREKLDVVVEILDPKNEDIVRSYGADRIIVSNRYFSHIISQICSREAIFELFADIFFYGKNELEYDGKELFVMKAEDFFAELPDRCTAFELIRWVFKAGEDDRKHMVLGYIRNEKNTVMFTGDQRLIDVELEPNDKLILYGRR